MSNNCTVTVIFLNQDDFICAAGIYYYVHILSSNLIFFDFTYSDHSVRVKVNLLFISVVYLVFSQTHSFTSICIRHLPSSTLTQPMATPSSVEHQVILFHPETFPVSMLSGAAPCTVYASPLVSPTARHITALATWCSRGVRWSRRRREVEEGWDVAGTTGYGGERGGGDPNAAFL